MTLVFYHAHDVQPEVLCARCLARLGSVPYYVLDADPTNHCKRCGKADKPDPRRPAGEVLTYTTALRLIIQRSAEHRHHAYWVLEHYNLADPSCHRHVALVIEDALTDDTADFNLFEQTDLLSLLTPPKPKVLRKSKGQRPTRKGKR